MTNSWFKKDRLSILARCLVAGLLLVAVLLKAFSPAESAMLVAGYGIPTWAIDLVSPFELLLAFALVLNLQPKLTYTVAAVTFGLFSIFSLYRALSGFESCGCFGSLTVNPWLTFTLDLLMLAMLYATWPQQSLGQQDPKQQPSWKLMPTMVAYLALAIPLGTQMVIASPVNELNAKNTPGVSQLQGLTILEPTEWIGNQFPLLAIIETTNAASFDLTQGDWTLHDCLHCIEARPRYKQLHKQGVNVLFIETPAFDTEGAIGEQVAGHAWLPDNREWFVQAPVEIKLSEGIVTSTSLDLPSIAEPSLVTKVDYVQEGHR